MASPSEDVSPPDSPASDGSGTMPSPGRVDGSPAIARRQSEDRLDAGNDDEDEDPEEEGEETAPREDDDDEEDEEDDDEEEITVRI